MATNAHHQLNAIAPSLNINAIAPTSETSRFQQFKIWLSTICGNLFDLLLSESNPEPKIVELQNREGELFWKIYDPITGCTIYCMTEYEVMEWLDSRHWRQ